MKDTIERNVQKGHEYELLVLDINLPDGSGFEICNAVKERHVDTAIIFVTAKDMESDLIKGYKKSSNHAGFRAYGF